MMRDAFERWYFTGTPAHARDMTADGRYKYMPAAVAWTVWQAAVRAEQERCIKVCVDFGREWICESTTSEIVDAIRAL